MTMQLICGVDEAGRGPLAGAVYAAAVILLASAILMAFMPKYRYAAGHAAEPVAGATPATQQA